ncbi:formin-like protein 18 [Tanacetum coccineum]
MSMVVKEDGPPDDDTWEPRPIKKSKTAKPIGPNRRHFTGLIGTRLNDQFHSATNRGICIIHSMSGPNAKQVEKGMELQFKGQYRNRKNKFKDEMFVSRGGYENPVKMQNFPPPGKSLSEWHELCDHFTSEKHLAHSAKNKANRAKLPQCSTQGSKSYAASRQEELGGSVEYLTRELSGCRRDQMQ